MVRRLGRSKANTNSPNEAAVGGAGDITPQLILCLPAFFVSTSGTCKRGAPRQLESPAIAHNLGSFLPCPPP